MAAYDYASATGYARGRDNWLDWPNMSTPAEATHHNRWDQAVADLKGLTFNVKDYTATGDGVADDSTAFADLIADLPATNDTNFFRASTVVIPPGEYKVASTLTFDSRVRIVAHGAWLKPTSALTGDVIQLKMRDSVIEGLSIDCANVVTGTGNGIRIGSGFNSDPMQNCALRDVQIYNAQGYGVYWDDGPMCRFDNLYVRDCALGGFYCSGDFSDNNHGVWTGCHVVGTVGVGWTFKDQTSASPAQRSCKHLLLGCKAFGVATGALVETDGNYGWLYCESLTGNAVEFTNGSGGFATTDSVSNVFNLTGPVVSYTESNTGRNIVNWQSGATTNWVSSQRVTVSPSWSASPVTDGNYSSADVLVPGVAVGDTLTVAAATPVTNGVLLFVEPSTGGQARVTLYNRSGGSVTPPSSIYIGRSNFA